MPAEYIPLLFPCSLAVLFYNNNPTTYKYRYKYNNYKYKYNKYKVG